MFENMTLLDFARGPALYWSLAIMVLGIVWRLVGIFLLKPRADLSEPRKGSLAAAGLRTIITRSLPVHELEKKVRFQHLTGYAWHIGLFIVVLLYGPHVAFWKSILGFGWPYLPTIVTTWAAVLTLAILITLLIRRMFHPVMRRINSIDDYISMLVIIVPLTTGLMAYAHVGPKYETMLAIHILSVEAMFIWIPFSKLMHMFMWVPSRYRTGTYYQRKGVKA